MVAGGTVKLLNTASGQELTAVADGNGAYSIALVPGVYRVSAVSGGLASEPANVTLLEAGKVTQDFTLVAGGIEDTITVTAGKGSARVGVETPQIVTVASALELEQRRPQSSFEAIERAPNLITVETSALRARPRLRGLDSARVRIGANG